MSSSDSSDTLEEILRPSDSESSRFSTEEENPFINTLWGIHQTLSTLRGTKVKFNVLKQVSAYVIQKHSLGISRFLFLGQ